MSKLKRVLSLLLCLAIVAGMIPAAWAADQSADVEDADWNEVQEIISQYNGEWINLPYYYPGAVQNTISATAISGNGDVGISSGGTQMYKSFNISKADFWEQTGVTSQDKAMYGWPLKAGTITIGETQEQDAKDLARTYTTITTSSGNGQNAVNGYDNDPYQSAFSGWVSDPDDESPWLQLYFEDGVTFDYWRTLNYGFYSGGNAKNNPKNATLKVSNDGNEWEVVDSVTGSSAIWSRQLENTVTAKYVRLEIGSVNQVPPVKIGAFKLYNKSEQPVEGPENLVPSYAENGGSVTASSQNGAAYAPIRAVNGAWEEGIKYASWWSKDNQAEYWLKLDMGRPIVFNRCIIRNDGAANPPDFANNTKDCEIQISEDGSNWTTIHAVQDNSANTIQIDFEQDYTAQYIRLYITDPTQGTTNLTRTKPRARIGAFELYHVDDAENTSVMQDVQDSVQNHFSEVQDILHAEIRTEQTLNDVPLEMKSWISATDNLMVMEVTSRALSGDVTLPVILSTVPDAAWRTADASADDNYMMVIRRSAPDTQTELGMKYTTEIAMATKVITNDQDSLAYEKSEDNLTRTEITLSPDETAYIVTAIGGGGRVYDANGDLWEDRDQTPADEAVRLLNSVSDVEDLAKLYERHQNWWKEYWMQSYIDIAGDGSDERLNKLQEYYYGAQYELGCTLREGGMAAGLYGLWHSTDAGQWHSDFHLNYNFVAGYYGAASSNRHELLLPAVDTLTDAIPLGKYNAGTTSELKGVNSGHVKKLIELGQVDETNGIQNAILFPVGVGPWGQATEYQQYHNETVNAPLSAFPFVEYYNATLDQEFLEETMYPYLELVLTFLEHWLLYDAENGTYTLMAGYNETSWSTNPAVELAAYKYCLRYGIEASEKLGKDPEQRQRWEKIYEGLADQPTTTRGGKTVLTLAESYPQTIPGDGNSIVLESIAPCEVFGYYSPASDLQTVQNTVDVFAEAGKWGQVNSFPKIFNAAVNCRYDVDAIITALASTLNDRLGRNLTVADGMHGIEKVGTTKAINNMMLLGDQGVIKLFGNWLENEDAKFVRLRAPGAFVFSAEYDGAAAEIVEGVTMYSEAGATATVASLWEEGMVVKDSEGNVVATTEGTAPNHSDEKTYTFATEAGETYTFEKIPVAVESVKLDRAEETMTVGDTLTLKATVLPEDAADKTVSWSSSDEAVATVAEDGTVTAVTEGKAIITVTTTDGAKKAFCEITVEKAQQGGGTITTPSYTITVTQNEGGKINPGTTSVRKGSDKTFTITANDGYKISDVLVDGKSVGAVSTYTFENVTTRHTITAKFEKIGETGNIGGFIDVHTNDWFADAVQYVVDEGLMNGTSSNTFTPNGATTRGMIVTILYRQAGSPEVESDGKTWWSDARVWAVANGISDGTNMDKEITREQLATMLYRYAELKGEDISKSTSLDSFKDGSKVSAYAADALKWAAAESIVTGKTGNIIDPQAGATRAETATMLMRFISLS